LLERHPLSQEYPNLSGRAWERLVQNLKQNGIVGNRKIILHEGKIVDGWQLQRSCVEADIKPNYESLKLPEGMTLEEYVETVNDLRRHETQEQAMKRAEDRRQRVIAARASGLSQRAIAEQEGISQRQIRRDLEDSGESGDSPELANGRVQGRDGKLYPASKGTEREANIPDRLKPYFDSVPLFEQATHLATRLANLCEEIEKTPAYLNAVRGKKHRDRSTYIREAGMFIKSITPKRPCPECGGEFEPSMENDPCKVCMDRGYQTAEEVNE
jgi:Homeodomain-like domain